MLTPNALTKIYNGAESGPLTLQILKISKTSTGYDLVVSDGKYCSQSIYPQISTEHNFKRFDIVCITKYTTNIKAGLTLIVIFEIEKKFSYDDQIGDPEILKIRCEDVPRNIIYEARDPNISESIAETSPSEPASHENDDSCFAPICALRTTSSDWTIKARVLVKKEIRNWGDPNNPGKVFDIILVDIKGDQIKGVFFDQAALKFYEKIEVLKIYSFSGGNIKNSNKVYSTIDNDYEISFGLNSVINVLPEDPNIPKISYNFKNIDYLPKLPNGTPVDICGFIQEIGNIINTFSKKGEPLIKRNILITDHTNHSIELTLWNNLAQLPEFSSLDVKDNPIICAKSVNINEYNKLSLSSNRFSTQIEFNPDNTQADFLRDWKKKSGNTYQSTPLTERKEKEPKPRTIAEIKEEWSNLLISNKNDTYRIMGILGKIQISDERQIWYTSCSNRGCKKKVSNTSDGNFYCEACNKTAPDCIYRYLCNIVISDCTGSIFATAFDEAMNFLFKVSAKDLYDMFLTDQEGADSFLSEFFGKLINVVVQVKENENNKAGYKLTVKRFDPYDWSLTLLNIKDIEGVF